MKRFLNKIKIWWCGDPLVIPRNPLYPEDEYESLANHYKRILTPYPELYAKELEYRKRRNEKKRRERIFLHKGYESAEKLKEAG